jgi:hypothetical protein
MSKKQNENYSRKTSMVDSGIRQEKKKNEEITKNL